MSAHVLEDLRKTTRRALREGAGDVVDGLGLAGMLVGSDRGGLGLGDREMVLVATELGRALSPSSFLSTVVLASTLLTHAETVTAAETLTVLAGGRIRCAVAIADTDAAWGAVPPPIAATSCGDGGWLLGGDIWGISTPSQPDMIVVAAAIDSDAALFAVDPVDVEVTPAGELDASRGLFRIALAQAPARLLSRDTAAGAIAETYRKGLLSVGAEQLGVARTCLETAVDYAKTRSQFGSPIGSFQAIKHRCAEVLLEVELADAVLDQAVESGTRVDAEVAFVVATRAAVSAAESNIHTHGGIGFTWEHSAHRYLRRARVNAALLGRATAHRDAIAASVGLTTAEGARQ